MAALVTLSGTPLVAVETKELGRSGRRVKREIPTGLESAVSALLDGPARPISVRQGWPISWLLPAATNDRLIKTEYQEMRILPFGVEARLVEHRNLVGIWGTGQNLSNHFPVAGPLIAMVPR